MITANKKDHPTANLAVEVGRPGSTSTYQEEPMPVQGSAQEAQSAHPRLSTATQFMAGLFGITFGTLGAESEYAVMFDRRTRVLYVAEPVDEREVVRLLIEVTGGQAAVVAAKEKASREACGFVAPITDDDVPPPFEHAPWCDWLTDPHPDGEGGAHDCYSDAPYLPATLSVRVDGMVASSPPLAAACAHLNLDGVLSVNLHMNQDNCKLIAGEMTGEFDARTARLLAAQLLAAAELVDGGVR